MEQIVSHATEIHHYLTFQPPNVHFVQVEQLILKQLILVSHVKEEKFTMKPLKAVKNHI